MLTLRIAMMALTIAAGGFLVWRAVVAYPEARRQATQATERAQNLSDAYQTLGATVRDLSQKNRRTEDSINEVRRQTKARGHAGDCGLCPAVRDGVGRLREIDHP
ncbi:MAG: hypothetical protein E6R04_06410 [Spirochaetes bacterium]|nr:MAG: hypothetical protein E6R04_06410 [Spirochaetota bacterium]